MHAGRIANIVKLGIHVSECLTYVSSHGLLCISWKSEPTDDKRVGLKD